MIVPHREADRFTSGWPGTRLVRPAHHVVITHHLAGTTRCRCTLRFRVEWSRFMCGILPPSPCSLLCVHIARTHRRVPPPTESRRRGLLGCIRSCCASFVGSSWGSSRISGGRERERERGTMAMKEFEMADVTAGQSVWCSCGCVRGACHLSPSCSTEHSRRTLPSTRQQHTHQQHPPQTLSLPYLCL